MMNRRLVLLFAAAGALAAYAALGDNGNFIANLVAPEQAVSAGGPPAVLASGVADKPLQHVALNPLGSLAAQSLDAILERPLFNPTRAPAPPAPPPAPVEKAPPVMADPVAAEEPVNPKDFTFIAVASGDGQPIAVLRWNPTGEIFHLRKGEAMLEWQVASIGARDVQLSRGGQSLDLKLFDRPVPPLAQAQEDDGQGEVMNPQTQTQQNSEQQLPSQFQPQGK